MAESELDKAADWLDRLVRDKTARGRITILTINEVAAKPRFQEARITASIEAPGFGPVEQELEYMVRRDFWPAVGDVLPATVHLERPERTEINWDAIARLRSGK